MENAAARKAVTEKFITRGEFAVQEVVPAKGFDPRRLLELAMLAELHSSHPIAKSIVAKGEALGLAPDAAAVTEHVDLPGQAGGGRGDRPPHPHHRLAEHRHGPCHQARLRGPGVHGARLHVGGGLRRHGVALAAIVNATRVLHGRAGA